MTIEIQVADLITATTALTTAVNVQKTTLDTAVTNASTSAATASSASTQASSAATNASSSATAASGSAATAAAQATNASTSFTNAANSATAANASATTATAQATTATTQSTNAGNSAAASAASAATATGQASTATTQATNASTSAVTAASSQTAASTSATAAANSQTASNGSASAALTSQTAASTSASAALTSQNAASTSASAASTSQTASSTSAGAASTSQSAAATSATAAANSATASTLSASNASTSQTSATASATLSTTNANTATTQNTASGTSASASAASATASAAARDLSIAAWAASTAPAETLAAMSQSLHVGAVVKVIIYDTSKDSDGGVWRKRCTDKSWFTEALGGSAWLAAKCVDEATARAVIQSAKSPELVANGTFDTGVAGWTSANSSAISWVSGALRVTNDAAAPNYGNAAQAISTVIGKSYSVTFSRIAGTGVGGFAVSNNAVNSPSIIQVSASAGLTTFTATATTTYILPLVGSNTASQYVDYDNISVKLADTTVSAAGYVYQSTATGSKYFSLTGTSGQTEVFRGIVSEFPAKVAIVAESARVVIYDLSTGAMWMVFKGNLAGGALYSGTLTSIACVGGLVTVGTSFGLCTLNFSSDYSFLRNTSTIAYNGNNLASRHVSGGPYITGATTGLVNSTVNDTAVTVLDNAPIDPATGMPVPTVAVATAGGVSVIRQDGTVVNDTSSVASAAAVHVAFSREGRLIRNWNDSGNRMGVYNGVDVVPLTSFSSASNYDFYFSSAASGVAPQLPLLAAGRFTPMKGSSQANGEVGGVVLMAINRANRAKTMLAAITNAYNSGWQVGDSRFCGLADVVSETITAPEMVVNPGPFVATTGYTGYQGAISVASGEITLTSDVGISASQFLPAPPPGGFIVGKAYRVMASVRCGTATNITMAARNSGYQDISVGASSALTTGVSGVLGLTFTVPSANTSIAINIVTPNTAGGYTGFLLSYSVKILDNDRSVKANGLAILGSLVKTAVATGAQLVAYSGFSTTNYLEQPYSANLDFGTGEWNAGAWMTTAASPATVAAAIAAGGGLGPELAVPTTSLTGWTTNQAGSLSSNGVSITITNTASVEAHAILSAVAVAGKTYAVSYTGSSTAFIIGGQREYFSPGITTYVLANNSANFRIGTDSGTSGSTKTFSNLSVREVIGVLPLFERTRLRNLQPFSNDITAAGWGSSNITKSSGSMVRASTGAAYLGSPAMASPMLVGTKFTVAALVKAKSMGGRFGLRPTGTYPDRVDAVFDIVAGTVVGVVNGGAFPVGTASIFGPDANGFYLCAATGTVGGTSLVNLVLGPTDSSLTIGGWEGGSTVLSDCFISGAAIFAGTLTAAQIQARGGVPLTTGTISATVPSFSLGLEASGKLVGTASDGTTVRTVISPSAIALSTPILAGLSYRATGALELTLNDTVVATTTGAALLTLSSPTSVLVVGNGITSTLPFPGSLSLLVVSATVPSSDQTAQIYRDELALFQPNAQCTLAGTSTAVTALTYDESTDLLHAGTSWGRSDFKGLLRIASEATTTGSITSLSAYQGTIITGGTSAKVYQPALQLRDELGRKEEARKALGKVPVFIDFTATASQTAFVLVKGYTVKALYRNGTLMRETTTGVFWTRSNDGYQETATLSVAATLGDWVSLMCVRSN